MISDDLSVVLTLSKMLLRQEISTQVTKHTDWIQSFKENNTFSVPLMNSK